MYNGFQFDTILSIVTGGYEILVAIHTHNWGCVLKMDDDFMLICQIINILNFVEY